MCRVAVCFFFIAILHTGIIKFLQANETSTDGSSNNNEELTTKPTEVEPVEDSEVPSKVEADDKSGVSSKAETKVQEASHVPEKKDDKREAKANESKKEDVTEKSISNDTRKFLPDMLKGASVENTKGLFDFPKNILGPVNVVGAKIGEAVSKSIDTAKDLAGGTFNFLRSSAASLFED